MSFVTISMLVLTLLTINVLLVLNYVTTEAIGVVEDRVEVSVDFHNHVSEDTVAVAVEYLRGLGQVRDVRLIEADTVLEQFVQTHASDETILSSLDEVGGNPFGPMLIIKAHETKDFEFIIDALDNPQFRDSIREMDFSKYENVVTNIRNTTDQIKIFGIGLSAVFFLIAIFIILNTVRMSLVVHREEIGIMKLVGASNWFVRAPFLLEMIILSAITVMLVIAIMFPTVSFLNLRLGAFFGGADLGLIQYFEANGLLIYGVQFAGLVFVTCLSTYLAMKRYLRV